MAWSAGEQRTEGFEKTLKVIVESQRRIEQRLEEVWRATAVPGRRSSIRGADAELVPAALPLPSALDRDAAGELQDGEEDDEQQYEVARSSSHGSGNTSPSEADVHVAWSLPEAWPSNLQLRRFRNEAFEVSTMARIFTQSLSEPLASLEAHAGHGQPLHALATDLADWNLKSAHKRLLLDPHGPVRVLFDFASCAFLFYDLVGLPVILAWGIPVTGVLWNLALCIDLFWLADMVLTFFTGYFHSGVLVMDPVSIVKHYAKSWMLPDLVILISNFVGLWLSTNGEVPSQTVKFIRFAKLTRMLRIINVVRLLRMNEVVERLADRFDGVNMMEIIEAPTLVLLIVFINHLIACTWFAIGQSSFSDTGTNWLQTPLQRGAETYETVGMMYQYLSCIHWSITQMTPGSMQIHAVNSLERAFTVLCLICGIVFFSSIVSSLTSTMTKQRLRRQARAKDLKTLRKLLRQGAVPTPLVIAAQKHGSDRLKAGSRHVVADVRSMDFLSESMRATLHYELCRKHLSHPLFHWWEVVDTASVQRLCHGGVDCLHLHRHDTLFRASSHASAAYIVKRGKLMYCQDKQTARVAGHLEKSVGVGNWLSEAVLWTEWVHVGHADAVCVSEVMTVSAEKFKQVVESSRSSIFVCQQYGAAFHARMLSATPPSLRYPTDLEIPGCTFEEIVPSLPLTVREVISGAAFQQLRLSMWVRPNLLKDLAEQVQDGKCTLALSADSMVERLVAVVTLKLTRPDGRFLVEVWEYKAGSRKDACMLPGTKQREGETPSVTISRLAQTLEPYTDDMTWSQDGCVAERVCKTSAANIRSVYFRQTYEASMGSGFEDELASNFGLDIIPGGLVVMKQSGAKPQSESAETGVAEDVNFKAYAWLSNDEFEHFKSDRGRKHLSACLEDLQAEMCAAAASPAISI